MTDHLAILDSAAPSLSLERAARSYHEERIPLSPPLPDRDLRWRWGVAIIAAILLHIAVVTMIDNGFLLSKPDKPAPIPVDIVMEQPPPPPPTPREKPIQKPEEKPPEPPEGIPSEAFSGGDLGEKVAPGALEPPTTAEEKPPTPTPAPPVPTPEVPTPASAPPLPLPEPPTPIAGPALPTEPSPEAVPVPPASSPRDTQQALAPPPVPAKKPPAPPIRQTTATTPPLPQQPTSASNQGLFLGEGGGNKYLNALRDQVRRHQYYPPTAEMFHIVGRATYELKIDRQGQLLDAQLSESSGSGMLDKAGFMTLRSAAPFGPVPEDFAPGRDVIGITIILTMAPP